jgi:transcriptional regulator with XRE-family HTH domain
MDQGRRPNRELRSEISRLRDQGLTQAEIGRRVGVSRQAVQQNLRAMNKETLAPPICCRVCRRVVCENHRPGTISPDVLCLECLAKGHAEHFGERLRSFRVAAGLTQEELGKQIGTSRNHIGEYERKKDAYLRWSKLLALVRVLGTELVTSGLDAPNNAGAKP